MSQNRGKSTSSFDKLGNSSFQNNTRFSYNGAGASGAGDTNNNRKGIKALWRSQDENAPVESQLMDAKLMNSQLEGANLNLKQQLQEALFKLEASHDGFGSLMKGAATSPAPSSAAAANAATTFLQQERAQQEIRNAKALALLQSKDDTINSLETRYAESSAEAAQLRAQLQATTQQLKESQDRVQNLLEDDTTHKKSLSDVTRRYEHAQAEAELLKDAEKRALDSNAALERVSKELASTKDEVATMTTALQAADEMIEEMQEAATHREKECRNKGREVDQLRSYVVRLVGLASEEAQRALEAPLRAKTDVASTIAALEEANEALEIALVAANLRLAGVDPSRHSTADSLLAELVSRHHPSVTRPLDSMHPEDSDEIVRLCGEVADLGGKLEAAEEEKTHLESARSVAQRAALHAEAELQSLLSQHAELKSSEFSLIEKLDAESQRAAAAEALCVELEQEIENATERANKQAQTVKELSEKCESLGNKAMVAEGKVEHAERAAELAKQQAAVDKENAAERVAAALRQSGQLKTQMLDAQKENDNLKSKIASLESKVSFAAAKAAAQQAAEALTAHRNRALAVNTPVQVLAHAVAEAAQQQIQLQMELQTCTELNCIHERTIEGLRGSVSRLRAALAEEEVEEGTVAVEECDVSPSPLLETPSPTSIAAVASLRDQVACSLAAQKGQAQAFAALIEEASQRETLLETQLNESQFESQCIEEERQRLEGMCAASVATMHGALAQIALAQGDEDTGDALLQSDVNPEDLNYVTSAVSAKLQEFAKQIVRELQETDDGDSKSPSAVLAASQREVIAALSATLASNSTVTTAESSFSAVTKPACSSTSSDSLKGLCGLLRNQLKALEKTIGCVDGIQSMHSTIMVIQSEIVAALDQLSQDSTAEAAVFPLPGSPTASTTTAVLQKQVDDLTERLTLTSERLALLTAANEAAQTEASHGKAAVAELADALQQAHADHEETAQQAAVREGELQYQLEETKNECRRLLDALKTLENDQKSWEVQVNARIAALQDKLEASAVENGTPATTATTISPLPCPSQLPSGLETLLDGMDALLQDAFSMGERIKDLEAAAEKQAEDRTNTVQDRWNSFTAGILRCQQVASTRAEARNEIKALEMKSAKHAQRADALAQKVSELEKKQDELLQRLEAVRGVHQQQLEHSAQLHAAQLAAVSAEAEAHRQEMLRQSDAAALAAATAAEQTAYEDVKNRVDGARRALEEAQRMCSMLRNERDAVHAEFIRYREIKKAEVQLLEQRLGAFNPQEEDNNDDSDSVDPPMSFSDEVKIATAAGQIAGACRSDAVAAALREAKLERSHRIKIQESLESAQAAEKRATAATKAAEREVVLLRQRLVGATVGSEQQIKELKNKLEMAENEAQTAERAVQELKKHVEQLSQRVADLEHVEILSEQERHVAAQRDLAAVHAALSARDASIHHMTGRVMRAERDLEGLAHDLDQIE